MCFRGIQLFRNGQLRLPDIFIFLKFVGLCQIEQHSIKYRPLHFVISAKVFQLFPKPLLTVDQLILLKYDNVPSSKYQTNAEIGVPSKRAFDTEVEKYSYMWRDGGQFSTKKYDPVNNS